MCKSLYWRCSAGGWRYGALEDREERCQRNFTNVFTLDSLLKAIKNMASHPKIGMLVCKDPHWQAALGSLLKKRPVVTNFVDTHPNFRRIYHIQTSAENQCLKLLKRKENIVKIATKF